MYEDSCNPPQDLDLIYTDRTKRVKDARNEAQSEIEDYKKEKDNEYQEFEKKVGISYGIMQYRTR